MLLGFLVERAYLRETPPQRKIQPLNERASKRKTDKISRR